MLLWQLTLMVLYIVWSIITIRWFIIKPNDVWNKTGVIAFTTSLWLVITAFIIAFIVINIPWTIKIF